MNNLERYYKAEERDRIIGIIEMIRDMMSDSSYEQYAKKKLNECIEIIERREP